jgi:hypothetical protein
LKRVTRSFTVEYRQTKRQAACAKRGWADAKPAPAGIEESPNRITLSAFKPVTAHLPVDVSSPSIAPGRILPSLVQAAFVTEHIDAKARSYEGAAQAGDATEAPADEAVSGRRGEQIHSAERLEPLVATAKISRPKRPARLSTSALKAGPSRSEKRTPGPEEKRETFNKASRAFGDMLKSLPVTPPSNPSLVDKPSAPSRTSRILNRYVFRDERGPGENWKRKIEARRKHRG